MDFNYFGELAINGGLVRLTTFTSDTVMQGVIETELTSVGLAKR